MHYDNKNTLLSGLPGPDQSELVKDIKISKYMVEKEKERRKRSSVALVLWREGYLKEGSEE